MSDPIVAEGADGSSHEFPPDTNPAIVDRVMKQYAMQWKIRARMSGLPDALKNKTVSNIASTAMGAADPILGLNSLLDKGVGGAAQLITSAGGLLPNPVSDYMGRIAKSGEQVSDTLNQNLQGMRAQTGQGGFDPLRLAGNIASPVNAIMPAATTLPDAIGTGAAFGAMQPTSEGQSPLQPVANAAMGGAGGAAGYGASKLAGQLLNKTPPPPTTAQLKGSAGYDKFAKTPITLTPEASSALSDNVGKTAIQQAMDEAQINQEPHLVSEFQTLLQNPQGQTVTTEAADKIRQAFDSLAHDAGTPNAARGWSSRSDAMETAIQQTPEINDARNTWAQFRKSEILDKTIAKATDAQGTPAGFGDSAQAIKREFLKLARSQKFNSFSDEEQKAITDVANGTLTTNTLQRLGKFSPIKSHLTGLLELGGGALGMGGIVPGGTLPAIGLAAAGEAARQGSNFATSRAAQMASELVRRGGPAASPVLSPTAQAATQQAPGILGRITPAMLAQLLQSGAGAPAYGQAP